MAFAWLGLNRETEKARSACSRSLFYFPFKPQAGGSANERTSGIYFEQHIARRGTCNGCGLGIGRKRTRRTGDVRKKNRGHSRHLCLFPVAHAHARLVLCDFAPLCISRGRPFLPFVSFALLLYIGGKLCLEGIKGETDENPDSGLGIKALFLQGIATSIDALSVGFTLASYRAAEALLSSVLIALTTFFLCFGALHAGKQAGAVFKPPGQDTWRPHLNCHRRAIFIAA